MQDHSRYYDLVPALKFIDNNTVRADRGLLPYPDPLEKFPEEFSELGVYDDAARHLPQWLYSGCARQELEKLPVLPVEHLEGPVLDLAFRHFSFFVSAYAWADCVEDPDAPHAKVIPENLSLLICRVAQKLGVMPILQYYYYTLYDFALLDPSRPFTIRNMRVLQHFTIPPWAQHEAGFILSRVEIGAEAGPGLTAIPPAKLAAYRDDRDSYIINCWAIHDALNVMTETMKSIPRVCSPKIYWRHVRPWIFYFTDIMYDGVGFFQKLKGQTGAESSEVESFDIALGVLHKKSELTDHLHELRSYRPPGHQAWLDAITQGSSLRAYALEHTDDPDVKDAHNAACQALVDFRKAHRRNTHIYIKEPGRGDIATGLTHYELFLDQLIKETEDTMIP